MQSDHKGWHFLHGMCSPNVSCSAVSLVLEERFSLLLQANFINTEVSSSSSATKCTRDLADFPCATVVVGAERSNSWRCPSFAMPSSESSIEDAEMLESLEQSLEALLTSTDLSVVNDGGRYIEVTAVDWTDMSCALAVASARRTDQSGT